MDCKQAAIPTIILMEDFQKTGSWLVRATVRLTIIRMNSFVQLAFPYCTLYTDGRVSKRFVLSAVLKVSRGRDGSELQHGNETGFVMNSACFSLKIQSTALHRLTAWPSFNLTSILCNHNIWARPYFIRHLIWTGKRHGRTTGQRGEWEKTYRIFLVQQLHTADYLHYMGQRVR